MAVVVEGDSQLSRCFQAWEGQDKAHGVLLPGSFKEMKQALLERLSLKLVTCIRVITVNDVYEMNHMNCAN